MKSEAISTSSACGMFHRLDLGAQKPSPSGEGFSISSRVVIVSKRVIFCLQRRDPFLRSRCICFSSVGFSPNPILSPSGESRLITMENYMAFKNARRRYLASLSWTEKIRRMEEMRKRVATVRRAFCHPLRKSCKAIR